jgi:hypothetical protein
MLARESGRILADVIQLSSDGSCDELSQPNSPKRPSPQHQPETLYQDANAQNDSLFCNLQNEGGGSPHGVPVADAQINSLDSSAATEPYNPIPPPLPLDANDAHFEAPQPVKEKLPTGTLSSNRCDVVKKKRARSPVPSSSTKMAPVEKTSPSAALNSAPNIGVLDAANAGSSTADNRHLLPVSCSTQMTGAGRYTGGFNHTGQFHGYGTFEWIGESAWQGDSYKGMWVDGEKNGHGVYTSADGTVYDGLWTRNKKNGHGCTTYNSDGRSMLSNFTWCEGDSYDGEFVDNARHGACEYTWFNGEKLRCVWEHGKCHEWSKKNAEILNMFSVSSSHLELVGQLELLPKLRKAGLDDGTLVFCKTTSELLSVGFDSKTAKGLIDCIPALQFVRLDMPNGCIYRGETFRGVFHGQGVLQYKEGDAYDGGWRYGHRHGHGIMHYNSSGSDSFGNKWSQGDKYKGEFKNDVRHGGCEYRPYPSHLNRFSVLF